MMKIMFDFFPGNNNSRGNSSPELSGCNPEVKPPPNGMTPVFLEPKPDPHLHHLSSSDPMDLKESSHYQTQANRKDVVANSRIIKLLPPTIESNLSVPSQSELVDMRLKQSSSPENRASMHCLTAPSVEQFYRHS